MAKNVIIFCFLLTTCLSFATTLNESDVKIVGRALANYQVCSEIAEDQGDKVMHSYYSEMFNDSAAEIRTYPLHLVDIIYREFSDSVDRLKQIDKQGMKQFCLSRFGELSRKMQMQMQMKKKKLTEQ